MQSVHSVLQAALSWQSDGAQLCTCLPPSSAISKTKRLHSGAEHQALQALNNATISGAWVPPLTEALNGAYRSEALRRVKVPVEVLDLLADLRTFLQEKCEPPVYVSDRRLIKALNLLQV